MTIDPLPENAEVIGPLVFVPNPDYPYPFPVARPPRFWMEETTGRLAAAVERYMQGEPLTADQLEVIKLYLTQYLERAVIEGSADRKRLLSRIDRLRTTRDIERFADELSEVGVEPF
ncbi:hypothetical protein A6A03_14225 [Chloroflexus islandicus]|uniref:Uncharacterized protein n=1 Tax=Chloroflexus islandicus TaxID=1707952 RepID=A0A178MBX8_9CHLR|nr:hypothetical protein [Chloroflexus islandicus]OAN45518.1 hypothetical protein A6A03_14225 [Chloroflexus islandicus]